MGLHGIARVDGVFQGLHDDDSSGDLVCTLVAQHLEHVEMVLRIARLLEYPATGAYDDGICGDDESGFGHVLVVDLARVDLAALFGGGLEDIFVGGQRLGKVFFEGRRDDFDIFEAQLAGA